MASTILQLLLFSFTLHTILCVSQKPNSPNTAIILPVTKHVPSLQYITQIHLGTPPTLINLVLDLNGPFLWFDCSSISSSFHTLHSTSLKCSLPNSNPPCSTKTCFLSTENTITGMTTQGNLAEEIITIKSIERSNKMGSISSSVSLRHFLFSCVSTLQLKGLANGVKGMLGLGRTRISLPSQLSTSVGFRRSFAVCLSSMNGFIVSGDSSYISKSLVYTPLNTTTSEGYFITVKSIKVNSRRLSIKVIGGTKISTVVPYTTMETTVYDIFVKAYMKAATTSMNMTMVEPVAPFGVCFRTVPERLAVPAIDMVLQSEMVKWRIDGRNSMVKVSDKVMCLGFLDGGLTQRNSIVIGGYQLEDNILEFNLGTSMFGFRRTSCSDLKFSSTKSESL